MVSSVIIIILSIKNKTRNHMLRIGGILTVITLSILANNAWCYFAAIFIIGTTITKLEFLQIIAAIIRGDNKYFDFEKHRLDLEIMSNREVEEQKSKEYDEIDDEEHKENGEEENIQQEGMDSIGGTLFVNSPFKEAGLKPYHYAFLVEEYTFRFLEKKYNSFIKRNVRMVINGSALEIDGLMESKGRLVIFEIKSSRSGRLPYSYIEKSIMNQINVLNQYKIKNKREVELRYVIVGNFSDNYKTNIFKRINDLVNNFDMMIKIDFYTFKEIGMEDIVE